MRKLAIAVVIILVLVVIVALALPYFLDVNSYHDTIQAKLQEKSGRQVSLGRLHLSILPLYFSAENPVIGEDPNFPTGRPFAQASAVDVSVELLPLLHKDVQISSLELKQPKIELVRNARGVWNYATLGHPSAAPSQAPAQRAPQPKQPSAPEQQPSSGGSQGLSLQDLKITDGQLALTDYQKRQPRAVYDHVDLRLVGYAPDRAFDFEAAAHLPGKGTETIKLAGKAGPLNNTESVNTPFDGSLEFQEVSLSGLQKFLNSASLENTDAVISGKANLRSQAGRFDSDGSLKLEQPRVHGHELGYPISADYKVSDDLNAERLNIEKGNLKLGGTPIAITGVMNTKPTPSQVDLKIDAPNISIAEVAQLAAAFGTAFSLGTNIAGQLTADIHAQGAANQPALSGKLEGRNLEISGKDLRSPVKVPAIDLALTPTEIRSNDFSASTGGTTVTGRLTVSQYTSNSPLVDADLHTGRADLGEFLSIAKAYGVSAAEGVTGSGIISLNVHATGPVKNSANMNFAGDGMLQNAQIKTPSITEPLKVANANLRFSRNTAVLDNLKTTVGSTNANGSLTLRDFQNPQVQFTLAADKIIAAEWQKIFGTSSGNKASLETHFWDVVPRAEAAPAAEPSIINRMTGNGKVNVGSIVYDDLVLNNVQSNVTIDHGVIRMEPVTASVAQGQETGSIVIDARGTPINYAMNMKLDQADANQLLSSMSNLKKTLYGMLAGSGNLRFASGSDSIARTLNGNVGLNLTNGKLANVDVLYQLANIGKFLSTGKTISQHGFTNLSKLTGNFNVQNGLAQTNDLQAIIDGATLSANGLVNLVDNSANMHVTAVLTKPMTDSLGGINNVGGLMTTALANRNGELVMPVIVTGSLSNPHIVPDLEAIARMRLQNLLPTASKPGDLTSGLLGALLGNKNNNQQQTPPNDQQQQQQPQQQNNKGIQGILDQLGGHHQQQQQQPQPGQQQPAQEPAPQQPAQQPNGGQQAQPNGAQAGQQPQQQQKPTWGDVLNGILNKKKQQPANQQPQPTPTPDQQPQK
jgi:AsmA protein